MQGKALVFHVERNEEGKLDGLPHNSQATEIWRKQVEADGKTELRDFLVGPIVVITGDDALLSDL